MDRIILHCDCNSFFASVEAMLDPSLKNVPMAVCGSEEARHGIVLAKNELAKACGIKTAETVWSAKKKCKDLVIVQPHHSEYIRVSREVNMIYRRYTDLIEPFGIDECWLDVTGSQRLFGDGYSIAKKIKEEIKREIGITVSVGVSFNKIFAKLGSDYKKPDAITEINRENYKKIVYPLPVDDLLFVGNRTAEELKKMGIKTIGELAATDERFLVYKFGKQGRMLSTYARGEDDSPVASMYDKHDPKSIGNGMTFKKDISSDDEIKMGIAFLAEEIGERMRKKNKKCNTVCVTIRDTLLCNITRQRHLKQPTNISSEIAAVAFDIVKAEWKTGKPIRMLTVSVSSLVNECEATSQTDLFDEGVAEERKKAESLDKALDKLREKHGKGIISRADIIGNELGISLSDDRKTEESTNK